MGSMENGIASSHERTTLKNVPNVSPIKSPSSTLPQLYFEGNQTMDEVERANMITASLCNGRQEHSSCTVSSPSRASAFANSTDENDSSVTSRSFAKREESKMDFNTSRIAAATQAIIKDDALEKRMVNISGATSNSESTQSRVFASQTGDDQDDIESQRSSPPYASVSKQSSSHRIRQHSTSEGGNKRQAYACGSGESDISSGLDSFSTADQQRETTDSSTEGLRQWLRTTGAQPLSSSIDDKLRSSETCKSENSPFELERLNSCGNIPSDFDRQTQLLEEGGFAAGSEQWVAIGRRALSEPDRNTSFWFPETLCIRRRSRNNSNNNRYIMPFQTPPPRQFRHSCSVDVLQGEMMSVVPTVVDESPNGSAGAVPVDSHSSGTALLASQDDSVEGASSPETNGESFEPPPIQQGATSSAAEPTADAGAAQPPPTDPNRDARVRWIRINRRFQLMISIVAILFSFLLFAILISWIVLTSAYVVTMNRSCDIPLKSYYWLVTLQLVLQIFRADILRFILCWDPTIREGRPERIPPRVVIYNFAYLVFALMVLRMGFNSIFIEGFSSESTCRNTSPELFHATMIFVVLTVAAWTTIVLGYMVPFCFVASLLTWNGYNPGDAQGGGALGTGVFPAAYSRTGAPPGCVDMLREVNLDELDRDDVPMECCICMEDFVAPGASTGRLSSDDAIVVTECGHVFHKACCREWLHQARTCPVCRTDIPDSQAAHQQNDGGQVQGETDVSPEDQFPDSNHSTLEGQPSTASPQQMESHNSSIQQSSLHRQENLVLRFIRNRQRRAEGLRQSSPASGAGSPNVEMTQARDNSQSNSN